MRADLWDFLHAGDFACANGDGEALARVCLQLTDLVDDRTAASAVRVARLSRGDLLLATAEWGELAATLRGAQNSRPQFQDLGEDDDPDQDALFV